MCNNILLCGTERVSELKDIGNADIVNKYSYVDYDNYDYVITDNPRSCSINEYHPRCKTILWYDGYGSININQYDLVIAQNDYASEHVWMEYGIKAPVINPCYSFFEYYTYDKTELDKLYEISCLSADSYSFLSIEPDIFASHFIQELCVIDELFKKQNKEFVFTIITDDVNAKIIISQFCEAHDWTTLECCIISRRECTDKDLATLMNTHNYYIDTTDNGHSEYIIKAVCCGCVPIVYSCGTNLAVTTSKPLVGELYVNDSNELCLSCDYNTFKNHVAELVEKHPYIEIDKNTPEQLTNDFKDVLENISDYSYRQSLNKQVVTVCD